MLLAIHCFFLNLDFRFALIHIYVCATHMLCLEAEGSCNSTTACTLFSVVTSKYISLCRYMLLIRWTGRELEELRQNFRLCIQKGMQVIPC